MLKKGLYSMFKTSSPEFNRQDRPYRKNTVGIKYT